MIKFDTHYRDIVLGNASGTSWPDERYYYDSSTVMYICKNSIHPTEESAESWYVWKYTLDVDGNVTRKEGPLTGSVTNRASLGWGA